MKIIGRDNFNRDTVDDVLIAENVSGYYAEIIKNYLNADDKNDRYYFDVTEDDYKLQKWEP